MKPTSINSTIVGLPELLRKLDSLGKVGKGEAMINAVVAGAMKVNNKAKENTPKKTRTLMRSIHIGNHVEESAPGFTAGDVGGEYSDVGGEVIGENNASVLVGSNLVYAAAQEFGYPEGNIPAHPYLRPAFDTEKEAAMKDMGRALKVLVDKASK
jgi:HK97 gp10 family phage protein